MTKRVLTAPLQTAPSGTSIVSSELEIRRLLTRAAEGHTPITLKVRGTEVMLRGKMLDVDPKTSGIQLALAPRPGDEGEVPGHEALEKLFTEAGTRECMVLIYLQGRSIVGINCEPSEVLGDRVIFAFPPKIFKIQRRKDVRFAIPKGYEFTVEFESLEQARVRIRKRILDISESGLAFFVLSPREAALFRRGLIIRDCFIQIQHQRIPVMLRVCSHAAYDRGAQGSGNKVGTEFEQISPDDKDFIAQYVYSHAQHLFY